MFIVRYLVAGLVGWWLVRWRGGQAPSGVASVPSASLRCIESSPVRQPANGPGRDHVAAPFN